MEHLGKMKLPILGQVVGKVLPLLGMITVLKKTIPPEGQLVLGHCGKFLQGLFNPFCYYDIPEFDGSSPNELYREIELHLESCKAYGKATRLSLCRNQGSRAIKVRLHGADAIVATYKGMTVLWTHSEASRGKIYRREGDECREFCLRIRKRDKQLVLEYLDFITANANDHFGKTREISIYRQSGGRRISHSGRHSMWEPVPYKHPSTFDTLAMDPLLKEKVLADLISFQNDKSFYEQVGRAWKRGYLLYGPPGTGKSSMVAAMANFLKYDIYDLELTKVRDNSHLQQLLLETTNKSIILLEDIDCSYCFSRGNCDSPPGNRKKKLYSYHDEVEQEDPSRITLSGLLNFVDGLWSCCGEERIFIFTTNHIEKLDAALVRPGRMDMQIEMSYCTFPAFKLLARNYLSTEEHPLFEKVRLGFDGKTMTPAQVAEILIKNKVDVGATLEALIEALEENIPAEPSAATSNSDKAIASRSTVIPWKKDVPISEESPLAMISNDDLTSTMKEISTMSGDKLVKNKGDVDTTPLASIVTALKKNLPAEE